MHISSEIKYSCCNKLKELPPEIGYLQNLCKCSLSNNNLKILPKEIGFLKNLTELLISDNQLQYIPSTIGLLSNMVTLSLQGNILRSIPSELGNLRKLVNLNLSRNPLKVIPWEIGCLNLKLLDLQECPLSIDTNPIFIDKVISLKELAARTLVREKQIPEIHTQLKEYILAYSSCTSCGGMRNSL